jgi:ribosomal protein L20A (L18A)
MDSSDMQKLSRQERLQFDALVKGIEKAAFKKEKKHSTYKKIRVFKRVESKKTRILKNGNIQSGIQKIPSVPIQKSHIENLNEILKSFISEFALEIWRFKNYGDIDNAKKQFHEINKKHINKTKEFLKHMGFRLKARRAAIQILEKDLIDREKQILDSQDFKSFYKIHVESPAWKHRENEVMAKIKSLYKKEVKQDNGSLKTTSLFNYDLSSHPWLLNKDDTSKLQELSDRKIISNMAYIFAEIDFWNDKPTNSEIAEDIKSLNSMK